LESSGPSNHSITVDVEGTVISLMAGRPTAQTRLSLVLPGLP
jgi:hypothetical protein